MVSIIFWKYLLHKLPRLSFRHGRFVKHKISANSLPGSIHLSALFCTVSILSVRCLFRLVCHTGHAYSRTGLITLTYYMVTRSCWPIPALFNRYSMYNLFPAFATILSTCLFHVRSLELVTPGRLALLYIINLISINY